MTHRVDDFNGGGNDDIAWLSEDAEDVWNVATELEDFKGASKIGREESTEDMTIELELAYADVDSDGQIDDYILMIKGENGDAYLLHKPLGMAYFMMTQNMTVTEAWYDALSPEQQEALIADTQAHPKLKDSFSEMDDGMGVSVFTFNQFNFNESVNCANEMEIELSYTSAALDIPFENGAFGVKLFDFSLEGGFGAGMYGGELEFGVAQAEISYGPITGEVTASNVAAKAYVTDEGLAIGAGATLVGAGVTAGNNDGSHVSAGVGFGIGAGVGAAWGENDQFGAEIDIKFISLAVYVNGDDAKEVYGESKDWIVAAADDTADWAEVAVEDTTEFVVDTIEEPIVKISNDVADLAVDFSKGFGSSFGGFDPFGGFEAVLQGAVDGAVIGGATKDIVDDVSDVVVNSPVVDVAEDGFNAAVSGGGSVAK